MKMIDSAMKKSIIGLLLFSSTISFTEAKDISAVFEAAEEGSKIALYDLGVRYGSGNDVKQDKEVANQYYTKSALMGYAPAQNNLGWSYRQGIAVPKNSSKALYWFRLAALQGNALALQNLAEMFQQGDLFG